MTNQISQEDGKLILHHGERILLEIKASTPKGGGILYLTDHRFVFLGNESLSSGLEIPSGIIGLVLFPVMAILNLYRRSKSKDLIEFEIAYDDITDHRIKGKLTMTLEIIMGTESSEFSINRNLIDKVDRILYEQRGIERDQYPVSASISSSSGSSKSDFSNYANDLVELSIRFDIGEFTVEEYKQRKATIEINLPNYSKDSLDELKLRFEIGELTESEYIRITGRPTIDYDMSN